MGISRGRVRALSGLLAVLVAVTLLAVVGGAARSTARAAASAGHGTAAPQSVRAVDHALVAPHQAPSLDPVVLTDTVVVDAPTGIADEHQLSPAATDRVAPVASGRGPPTV